LAERVFKLLAKLVEVLGGVFFLHFFAFETHFSLNSAPWRLLLRAQRTKQA
jgi:hypothetical protein